MKVKSVIAALLLMMAGLQTAWAQGFRVYKTDGTVAQFSLRTDSIVFYDGIGSDVDFGPYTSINQMIVGTWYKSKTETVTFGENGKTNYIAGSTRAYKFLPYQGTLIIYSSTGVPKSILKVHDVTADTLVISSLGSSGFSYLTRSPQKQNVKSIVLSDESLTLQLGETHQLTATVMPEDADNRAVTWKSSNEDVAKVDANGVVSAIADGSCTITCTAKDGSGVKATCEVSVITHEWVDLGLPSGTLWATCNVGANSPEEYGDYFAWGETIGYNSGKTNFSWETYKYYDTTWGTVTKYCTNYNNGTVDNKTELEPEDDAATVRWGADWQMPSSDQMAELVYKSEYIERAATVFNGIWGVMITSKVNGNRIFLPAANYVDGETVGEYFNTDGTEKRYCLYWTRSLQADNSMQACRLWGILISNTSYQHPTSISAGRDRYQGLSIRPVRKQ